jgi:hypothetical protein
MFRAVTPPIIRSTAITASGTGQTVSATFRYRGAVETAAQLYVLLMMGGVTT